MKTLRVVSTLCVTAILVLGASTGQTSAGGHYGWGSAGGCGGQGYGGCGGCGYGGCGAGGYGGCGAGGCGLGATGGSTFWIVGDYAPYIIGHGPMYPAGDALVGYLYPSHATPLAPNTTGVPNPR
jgi:hypothetical protein